MSNDRTAEFMSLARGLADSGVVVASTKPNMGRYGGSAAVKSNNSSMEELKSFHKTAAALSKDIAATSAMLGELTRLVQSKSLFEDHSLPINNLVVQIKTNIESLNGRLEQAEAYMKIQKRINNQGSQEALNVVGQLQDEFCQTTAGFKKILQQRTDSIQDESQQLKAVYGNSSIQNNNNKKDLISLENKPPVYDFSSNSNAMGGGMTAFPTLDLTSGYNNNSSVMSPGESTSSQLPRPHGAREVGSSSYVTPTMRSDSLPTYSGSTSSYYGNTATANSFATPLTPLDIAQMEQESGQEQMMQLIPDQDYLRERADAMETVESNIVELGKVFNKLATMVSEHRDLVRRVEDNVDEANTNISLSLETLTDTLTSLRTNKALALKVFSVLVIFIILFITFFA